MRGFEPPWPLNLVAPEDFGVGDHRQLCLVAEKAAGERAQMNPKSEVPSPKVGGGGVGRSGGGVRAVRGQAVFVPELAEALAFAVVVAEHVHHPALAQPAVELGEELAPMGFGDRLLRRALGQGTECVQAREAQSGRCGVGKGVRRRRFRRRARRRKGGIGACPVSGLVLPARQSRIGFARLHQRHAAFPGLVLKSFPCNEERVSGGNLRRIFLRAFGQQARLAEHQHRF